ncbi:restriction endonuclease subunit S [Paenibacillus tyrfis]|uniref:restriction endonuclease subunit S n=1 Tax=Paenibacillus tyrfis TaxID=1501230 RepID=UPI0020A0D4C3|nr:restriction endonuclease subunit S [Paenibacillus tyrfis]MCP1311892.1 restriction endonuclease subunit S [Paenibacillus tyrfis]
MRVITVGEVVKIISGFAFKSDMFNEEENGIPLIRIRDVGQNNPATYYNGEYKEEYLVSKGNLLISMDGEFKISEWLGPVSLLNQRVCKIESSSPELLEKYLLYILPDALKKIEDSTPYVTVKHLSVSDIRKIQIRLPSISEQRFIIDILDKAQTLVDKRKQAITKLDELVQVLFLDMFGNPTANQKGYPIGTIKDLIIEAKYGTSKKANEGSGQFPYLRMNNITYQGYMYYSNLKYIDLDDKEQEKYLVQTGDLLFNRTNSKELVGKTAVFDSNEKMAIAGYLIRVRINDKGNPYFVSGYLNSKHGKKVLQEMCKNIIGMANINAQEMQNISILIPPKELQDSYEKKYRAIIQQKEKHFIQLQQLESNFQALLQKAFKGELKVKDGVAV